MSMPNRTVKKAAAISSAERAATQPPKTVKRPGGAAVPPDPRKVAKPTMGRGAARNAGKPVYRVPAPVKPKPMKK